MTVDAIELYHGDIGQRLWTAIRNQREQFSHASIVQAVGPETKVAARQLMKRLIAGGFIEKLPTGRGKYHLIRDNGHHAPRLNHRGGQAVRGLTTEQLWRTMRMLKEFTMPQLAAMASTEAVPVSVTMAYYYVGELVKAGYVQVSEPFTALGWAKGRACGRFMFITARYTGPLPPICQRGVGVFDPNINQLVWEKPRETDLCK